MTETLYRRPLPENLIPFSSLEGRAVFREALALGGLDGYFRLAEQFHTQADPAFCGLGSLVVALNALGIDPGRLWKGPWRWFAEELLDCCIPLEQVRQRGINLDELACLARCNGAKVELQRADAVPLEGLRSALTGAARGESVLIAAYDRAQLGQTGSGHYSPIGGYHHERDLALLLDVARFKYPPHWLGAESLWHAMLPADPDTGRARGWLVLHRERHGIGLGYSLRCTEGSLGSLAAQQGAAFTALAQADSLAALVAAVQPLAAQVELRAPASPAHTEALQRARTALRSLPLFANVQALAGAHAAEPATLLLLAAARQLTPAQQAWIEPTSSLESALQDEISHLAAQLEAFASYAATPCR